MDFIHRKKNYSYRVLMANTLELLLRPDHIFCVLHAFVSILSCSAVSIIMNACHLFKQMLCLATFVFLLLMQLQNCVHSVLIFYL